MKHTIRLVGDINADLYRKFSARLAEIEASDDASSVVYIELNSEGGNAYDALAFAARMRLSSCTFVVTAYGLVASAAVLILAAGDARCMTKESWVMVHDSSDSLEGTVPHLERESKQLRRLEDQWVELLDKLTGTDWKIWEDLQSKSAYLSAEECLKLGLVDEVI